MIATFGGLVLLAVLLTTISDRLSFFLSATPHYFHLICSHLFPSDVPAILKLRTHHALAISSSISCTSVSHLSIGPTTRRAGLLCRAAAEVQRGQGSHRGGAAGAAGAAGGLADVGQCWPVVHATMARCHGGSMMFHDFDDRVGTWCCWASHRRPSSSWRSCLVHVGPSWHLAALRISVSGSWDIT